MKAEDERIAKPGILGSVIFILIFILVLLWFGVSEENPEVSVGKSGGTGVLEAVVQSSPIRTLPLPDAASDV